MASRNLLMLLGIIAVVPFVMARENPTGGEASQIGTVS
jgi:hypothetical protein